MNEIYQDYTEKDLTFSKFLSQSFLWMFIGLVICFGGGIIIASSSALLTILIDFPIIIPLAFIVELILVVYLRVRIEKLSASSAKFIFILYALLNALTFGIIFCYFELASIIYVFAGSAALFGAMAVLGYTTKVDLSKFRTILLIGLFVLIISSIFVAILGLFANTTWILISSGLGILLFTFFTAYDVQLIKRWYHATNNQGAVAIYGALMLFLDFINIFIYILRVVGKKR